MDRRLFFRAAATGLLVVGRPTAAAALPRVALVDNNVPPSEMADNRYTKALFRGLRERGLEDGRNIIVVRRPFISGARCQRSQRQSRVCKQ